MIYNSKTRIGILISDLDSKVQTFSVRACTCARTHVGAAIYVQIGAGKFSEICVRMSA